MSVKRKANVLLESGLPLDRCSIRWKINNFSAYLSDYLTCIKSESDGRVLRSCEFSSNSGHNWKLLISKWERSPRGNDYEVGFWISLLSTHHSMVNFNSECSININGQKHATKTSHVCDVEENKAIMLLQTGKEELIKLLNKKNSENVAVIELDIEVWSEETITVSHATSSESLERVPKKITKLWSDQTLTDVVLQCQGKEFKAHKLILAAASPVFEAMFKKDTKEHLDSCVNIEDMDSDVFEVFLHFIYTNQVDELDEMYLDLLAVADKYDVQPLREICIQHMAKNISLDNAVEVLALAERHSIESIKSKTLQFINKNVLNVSTTDAWTDLIKCYPHLVRELFLVSAK